MTSILLKLTSHKIALLSTGTELLHDSLVHLIPVLSEMLTSGKQYKKNKAEMITRLDKFTKKLGKQN